MAGFAKAHPAERRGRAFPHSRYDDPRGGKASALERNVLRYRAVEATLYLYYAEEVRRFMLTSVYPPHLASASVEERSDSKLMTTLFALANKAMEDGTITRDEHHRMQLVLRRDAKEGKKLKRAFDHAVSVGMLTCDEANELRDLLDYRNDLAHRIHLVMADVTRSYFTADLLSYRPPAYKGEALDKLRQYWRVLESRTKSIVHLFRYDALVFDHAQRVYEDELRRLDSIILRQIILETRRRNAVLAECNLLGTGLEGDLFPRSPANFLSNGRDGGPDSGHLTKRGAEICYRLFDLEKSPLAVAYLMGMSLRAASARHRSWKRLGGHDRNKLDL